MHSLSTIGANVIIFTEAGNRPTVDVIRHPARLNMRERTLSLARRRLHTYRSTHDLAMDVAGRRPARSRFGGLATPGRFAYTPARQRAGRPPAEALAKAGGKSGLHGTAVPGNARRVT